MPLSPEHRRTLRSLVITLAFVWVGCVAYALLQQVSGVLTLRDFEGDPLDFLRFITLYHWLPWTILAPCVAVYSSRFPIRPDRWALPLAGHAVVLLVLSVAHGLGAAFVYHYSSGGDPSITAFAPWQHAGHFLFGDDMLLFDTIVYAVFAATFNIRNFIEIVRRQEIDAGRLNQRLAELRLQTLRMQIDPHFLFNALNAISVLIKKGENARADRMITLLSRFFRNTLESADRHWVTLDEELELVRQYLEIAKLRFGGRLEVRDHCAAAAQRATVPAMLLQPLVENAVTHGFEDKVDVCELSLDCRVQGNRLLIEIADNGAGGAFYSDPEFEEGTGLANVCGRLEQMYGRDHAFELSSAPGRGTRIRIDLPLQAKSMTVAR